MTQAQQDALQRAFEILGEHFDGHVICVHSNCEEDEEDNVSEFQCAWNGGLSLGMGLVERTRMRMRYFSMKAFEVFDAEDEEGGPEEGDEDQSEI